MKRLYLFMPKIFLTVILFISIDAQAQSLFTAQVMGEGKPMILIHGLYCNGEVWKETVEHYQKKYECHVLTLSGFGGNSSMISDNFLELIKDSIILYTKNKKLHKPVLLGHSMGGFIALWAAASAPGIFKKVISVDGLPYLPAISMPGSPVDTIKSMALMIKKSMSNQTPEQIEAGQRQYLPSMISNKDRIDQVIKMAVKANSNTQAEVMYEMFTIDLRKTVASIDCPVLLLGAWIAYKDYGATHDNVLKGYREQVSAIKDCKVELNDSAKHFIFYDDPKWFYERTDQFLGMKISPGSQRKN